MKESCKWVRARLERFHDHELPPGEQARVEEHIEACPDCRAALAGLHRVDRLTQDASLVAHAEVDAPGSEQDAAEASVAAFRERVDIEAVGRLRRAETEADARTGSTAFMSAEQVASAPLEGEVVRTKRREPSDERIGATHTDWIASTDRADARTGPGQWLQGLLLRLFTPGPVWRWVSLTGAAAVVTAIGVILLVRDPDLPQKAMKEAAVRSAVEKGLVESSRVEREMTLSPADERDLDERDLLVSSGVDMEAARTSAPARTVTSAERNAAVSKKGLDPRMTTEPPLERATWGRAVESHLDAAVAIEADEPQLQVQDYRGAEERMWLKILNLSEASAKGDIEERLPITDSERIQLLLVVEEKLRARGALLSVPLIPVLDAAELSHSGEVAVQGVAEGTGVDRNGRALSVASTGEAGKATVARDKITASPSLAAAWMVLGDGWYLLWQGGVDSREETRSLAAQALAAHEQELAAHAQALAAYAQALAAHEHASTLTREELDRARRRIELLKRLEDRSRDR